MQTEIKPIIKRNVGSEEIDGKKLDIAYNNENIDRPMIVLQLLMASVFY
jgi:hypothetical protein